jgi:micrococcal nuclease
MRFSLRLVSALVLVSFLASVPTAGAQESSTALVSRVIDGDTIEVSYPDEREETVRLIGIDTPESVAPGRSVECGAQNAAGTLRNLVEGRTVQLTADPTQDQVDRYGRRLAYVDTENFDAGREMVRRGWSDVYVYDGRPFTRQPSYEQARDEAAGSGSGVWTECDGNFHGGSDVDEGPTAAELEAERERSAERFVRRYYLLLTQRRFPSAWGMLSQGLRRKLGSFSNWRAGYSRSLGTRVNSAKANWNGARAVVRVAIRSRDRDACSGRVVRQYFRGRWTVIRRGGFWRANHLTIWKVGGGTVRVAKSQCPRPKRPRRPGGGGGGGTGGGGCHPSYSPCLPIRDDMDCPEIGHEVRVIGPDEYRLDADNDGVACGGD